MVKSTEDYFFSDADGFEQFLRDADATQLRVRLYDRAVAAVLPPELGVSSIEEVQFSLDSFGLTLPFLRCPHLKAIHVDVFLDDEDHRLIGRHHAFEGGREDQSTLVVNLSTVFTDEFDHKTSLYFHAWIAKVEIFFHFLTKFYNFFHRKYFCIFAAMNKQLICSFLGAIALFGALMSTGSCAGHGGRDNDNVEQKDTIYPLGFLTDTLTMKTGVIKDGDTFSELMGRLGFPNSKLGALIDAGKDIFDVRRMRGGIKYEAYYAGDSLSGQLHYLVYKNNKVESTVFRCFDSLAVWKAVKPTSVELKYADVTINTSLWVDMQEAGASTYCIVKLADIYAWTVDFFGLQKGDRFRLFYEERSCDGEVVGVDTVRYAVFNRGSKEKHAVMFNPGPGAENVYWNEKGESLKSAFLKAPLQFTRISSGFTYRRADPINGVVMAHPAIDYAAPQGTPVVAIGDGTVQHAAWSGGAGNMIILSHSNGYESIYMHLYGYASGIKKGAHVKQGQVIGYVGSTGHSTGPHLDFRIRHNGTYLNPLNMESPSSEPLDAKYRPQLDSLIRTYSELMTHMD